MIGAGFIATLIIISSNCQPLGIEELTHIAQQRFNLYCYVESFNLELEELPTHSPIPYQNLAAINGTGATGTANPSISYSPSPSAEIPEE